VARPFFTRSHERPADVSIDPSASWEPTSPVTRLITVEDAPELASLLRDNRDFMASWEPLREPSYFTSQGQVETIRAALAEHGRGGNLPHVIVADGHVVGRITLNGIVRGAFQSCSVGYWVGEAWNGRGLASEALGEIVAIAFGELGLHRIQAETLLHNIASQRVLAHHGFERFGMAPKYLNIAGQWQDHEMYQLIRNDP
jgi:[ribosomal protein S5]-alanine N-acetyltransferase